MVLQLLHRLELAPANLSSPFNLHTKDHASGGNNVIECPTERSGDLRNLIVVSSTKHNQTCKKLVNYNGMGY